MMTEREPQHWLMHYQVLHQWDNEADHAEALEHLRSTIHALIAANIKDRAERDTLLTRVSELEQERDDGVAGVFELLHAAESRIESLVGEREELREALARLLEDYMARARLQPGADGYLGNAAMTATYKSAAKMLRSVLSSRETTDTDHLSEEERFFGSDGLP